MKTEQHISSTKSAQLQIQKLLGRGEKGNELRVRYKAILVCILFTFITDGEPGAHQLLLTLLFPISFTTLAWVHRN